MRGFYTSHCAEASPTEASLSAVIISISNVNDTLQRKQWGIHLMSLLNKAASWHKAHQTPPAIQQWIELNASSQMLSPLLLNKRNNSYCPPREERVSWAPRQAFPQFVLCHLWPRKRFISCFTILQALYHMCRGQIKEMMAFIWSISPKFRSNWHRLSLAHRGSCDFKCLLHTEIFSSGSEPRCWHRIHKQ